MWELGQGDVLGRPLLQLFLLTILGCGGHARLIRVPAGPAPEGR
jgi:hypothetical protein